MPRSGENDQIQTQHALVIGDRVLLRFPVEADRAEFIATRQVSRAFLEPWEPIREPGFDAWGDDGFDREIECRQLHTQERWLIVRRGDGAILGRLALTGIERGPFQCGRLGYWIGEHFAGNGYMTEAIRLGVSRCFGTMGLHRVEANVMPSNVASRRVLEKAGFECEGMSPKYLSIAGAWADHERWAITRDDDC